ncbi:MAG TPA: hypothetical protein VF713_01585 [Thermoanaerobaculia bacterium]
MKASIACAKGTLPGMPVYREVYLEKDEPVPVQPNLEDLTPRGDGRRERGALSLADFDDEQ